MKLVMMIIDGLGDVANASLDGKTPLETAHAPHIHYIASRGQVGQIKTVFDGFPIESMVCIMGLLGYDPADYYPAGRASFEAMAKGIPLTERDLVLRCNIVTLGPDGESLTDFTAGLIRDSDARRVLTQIELPFDTWELYPGQSYRNILILRGAGIDPVQMRCSEPHMNIGANVSDLLPQATGPDSEQVVAHLRDFLMDTRRQIAGMELPSRCQAKMLWTWSASRKPVWPSFSRRTGLKAAVVGGLDFLHGIAMAAKIHYEIVPGATGYIDTNYEGKAQFALKHLSDHDFVLVHVNASDEEAHAHNAPGKRRVIEEVDRIILGPLLHKLEREIDEPFRLVVCGDHTTQSTDGKHTDAYVPYALYGSGIPASQVSCFTEKSCAHHSPIDSLRFIEEIMLA